MAQVSIGQVENLKDLASGLLTIRETLETVCREQIDAVEGKCEEVHKEVKNSENLLEKALEQEGEVQHKLEAVLATLESANTNLCTARYALSACKLQPVDEDGKSPDCSDKESDVIEAENAVEQARAKLEQAQKDCEQIKANREAMERRVEYVKQALSMTDQAAEQARAECASRSAIVSRSVDVATARLGAAQQALNNYLLTSPSAKQFHSWLRWNPTRHSATITPDILRDRMNLSSTQRHFFQEYLYDRNPRYRGLVDKLRSEWKEAKGEVEQNMVSRKIRIHLSGELAEQMAQHALAPLGKRVETQGRTFVGDNGRYTKTDLLVTGLHAPVVLGRGEGMGAPTGGSMAFEIKCGKAEYLYSQKDHMVFQAAGHKQADAQCTLCSRDIHNLPLGKEKELRNTLREAGSPLVGMLPLKSEVDQSCLAFILQDEEPQI